MLDEKFNSVNYFSNVDKNLLESIDIDSLINQKK